ncbi:MAG: methionyl-tRNA formyltransferase [Clostridia bacterium]|nr:methionyl-tRNA formyltransferase [Clostridia bacterium]
MKVLFMGTPDFAVPVLEALVEKHNMTAVISQPDKPKGRGKKMKPTPVKEAAEKYGIPVYQPEKIKDEKFVELLKGIDADIFVVVAYGQILSQEILDIPKYGCINVHGSLLPKYRGAAPIQWSVINGEKETGVTIMYMVKALDSGDMILKRKMEITDDDTYETLHNRMAYVGADALIEAIELIEKGDVNAEKQEDSLATTAPMIKKDMGKIHWSRNSEEIRNKIRGFNPVPGAYTEYEGEILKIFKADIVEGYEKGEAGEILSVDKKKGFIVKTGNGALLIREVQAKGGKKMNCADYLRGHSVEEGKILGASEDNM